MTRGRVAVLLAAGLLLRLLALPLPGTGDVGIWKTWSYNAVVSGEPLLYGEGGQPPRHAELEYLGGDRRFKVDYPPLSLYTLGLAGRLYHRVAPGMPDTPLFTVFVKMPPLLAEAALAWLVFALVRRRAGVEAARLAMLACWLNPALLLDGAVLGYLDPLFLLPAVAAVAAAASGRTWVAGALAAAAALTKAQGLIVFPAVALAVVAQTPGGARRWESLALRVGEAAAGAALISAAVVWPFARAGTLPNMLVGLRSLSEHDMLSGYAANFWWIATWVIRGLDAMADAGAWEAFTTLPRILAISVVEDLGYPSPRTVGLALMGGAWLWALWRARHDSNFWVLAGLTSFLVHAYFVLAAQVHENHLILAVPFAVVAAAGRHAWYRIAAALTVIQALNLNLFYGFSEGLGHTLGVPRTLTIIDAAVVLSFANVAALAWHARVLVTQVGLLEELPAVETTG